jgi:hypothetical protein
MIGFCNPARIMLLESKPANFHQGFNYKVQNCHGLVKSRKRLSPALHAELAVAAAHVVDGGFARQRFVLSGAHYSASARRSQYTHATGQSRNLKIIRLD